MSQQASPSNVGSHVEDRQAIIGGGLLARAFDPAAVRTLGATVFASGVSNSQETDPAQYAREANLLADALVACPGRFVYFSTCSITDADRVSTPYAQHKQCMEAMIRERGNFLILRLPQVVGRTDNPHTLINHLVDRIRRGEHLTVWQHAIRCLVDVDDVAAIALHLLRNDLKRDYTLDVAPDEKLTLLDLVTLLESVLGQSAVYTLVDRGGGASPDSSTFNMYGPAAGVDTSAGYSRRLLQKYYGAGHD